MRELQRLEREHPDLVTLDSPTRRVGGRTAEGFASVRHAEPMLSLDNASNEDELRAFDERLRRGLDNARTVDNVPNLDNAPNLDNVPARAGLGPATSRMPCRTSPS